MSTAAHVIGWTEYVSLPEWNIGRIRAKIDTGARTSALHVDNIIEVRLGHVSFDVILHRKKSDKRITVVAPIKRQSRVRSSTGTMENRYVVETEFQLGPIQKKIQVSLASRGEMRFRMLLGRTAIAGDFVVDVGREHILGKPATPTKATKTAKTTKTTKATKSRSRTRESRS